MTFDDDFIQLETFAGRIRVMCKATGIDWPPPETVEVEGFRWNRESYSQITDEQRAEMTFVARGALYAPAAGSLDTRRKQ